MRKAAEEQCDWEQALALRCPEGLQLPLNVTVLDLSKCRLTELPGISKLRALTSLDLSVNRFKDVPPELAKLPDLSLLNLSRNFLKPNAESLLLSGLSRLHKLQQLDLRFNGKCGTQAFVELTEAHLPNVDVRVTLWAQMVGASPCVRDATLLRSQLEPWPTPALRRRLVQDFSQDPESLDNLDRGVVMQQLLDCYAKEGSSRRRARVEGVPVRSDLIAQLLEELRNWERQRANVQRERPSISAESYMIMRSPAEDLSDLGAKARRAAQKLQQHGRLWELAATAIGEADPEFASTYTHVAVTMGFRGSPHIDKQNVGPFYGLAMGNFTDGQGGICVECDARLVAEVNTKNRLGKVDGRVPHWVSPYDEGSDRFSLIFYRTEGEPCPFTTAVFAPMEEIVEEPCEGKLGMFVSASS